MSRKLDFQSKKIFFEIGQNIKTQRKNLKLTQMQFSQLIGCDKRYYQRIEAGQTCINVLTLIRIAGALNVPMSLLVEQRIEESAAMINPIAN